MQLLDYATKKGLISQEESNLIPITNVIRLINSPDVRNEIGLDLSKGELTRIADQDYFDKALSDMLRALASGGWTVSKLKRIEQRQDFIKKIKLEQGWGAYDARDRSPIIPDAPQAAIERKGEKPEEKKKKQSSRDSQFRKTPISSGVSMRIQNKRLLKIFKELKTIDVDYYINAASVLTRVFIEGCIDLYLQKNNIKLSQTLAAKGRSVWNHMISANSKQSEEVKNNLKGLETFYSDPSSIGSANTFNAVVHNTEFSLTPRELKIIWDRLEPCLSWFEGHV